MLPDTRSGAREFFERRFGHPGLPSRITQFEPVASRIEEIELPAREKPFPAIVEPIDGDFPFIENLARLHQRLRADGEGMVDIVILDE